MLGILVALGINRLTFSVTCLLMTITGPNIILMNWRFYQFESIHVNSYCLSRIFPLILLMTQTGPDIIDNSNEFKVTLE